MSWLVGCPSSRWPSFLQLWTRHQTGTLFFQPGSAKLLCSIFEECKALFHLVSDWEPQTSKLNWLKTKSTLDLIDLIALRHHICNLCLRASESSRTLYLLFLSLVNYNAATEMMAPEDLSYNGFGAEDSHFGAGFAVWISLTRETSC